jgi:para-aminobenzoate synthetase / 4-amino-4-deoxychorismate lyase
MAAMAHSRRPDPRQGVFETLLVLDGRPVELAAHLARLEASLAELFPDRPAPNLAEVDTPEGDCAMRIDVVPHDDRFEVEISFREIKQRSEQTALHSLAVPGGLGAHKWRDRSLLDRAQARLGGLPLVVDIDGSVLEAARANVFAVHDGALFTPPLDGRILPGVTRTRVIELAKSAAIPVHERPLRRDDLLHADEVLLSGSVRGIERADSLDGVPLAKKVDESSDRNQRETAEVDDQARRSRHEFRVAGLRGISGRGRIAQRHSASSGPR